MWVGSFPWKTNIKKIDTIPSILDSFFPRGPLLLSVRWESMVVVLQHLSQAQCHCSI